MERGLTISCLLPYWHRDEQGKESHYQRSSVLLFNDMIYIKNLDPNNIKNILIHWLCGTKLRTTLLPSYQQNKLVH